MWDFFWIILKYTFFLPWIILVNILQFIFGDLAGSIIGHLLAAYLYINFFFLSKSSCDSYRSSNDDNDYYYDDPPEPYSVAEHNGRAYDCYDDYPRCHDGSPDMRYAENYQHADDD